MPRKIRLKAPSARPASALAPMMAAKKTSGPNRNGKAKKNGSRVADQVAAFIGRTMGELLNRKDALTKQMTDVDRQIDEVRRRVVRQFGYYMPGQNRPSRARKAKARSADTARAVSAETRQKMAEAARKRWARERAKKAKAAKSR